MRNEPTWRITAGILLLVAGLVAYAVAVAQLIAPHLAGGPVLVQTLLYLMLGVVWLLPLRRFLIWMETGKWR